MEVAMGKIVLSRRELYDLVWSKSMAALIQKYEIKNSELRKKLSEMIIPILKWDIGKRFNMENQLK
jgi:hypothetical protein